MRSLLQLTLVISGAMMFLASSSGAEQANVLAPRFVAFDLRVVDAATEKPVAGALVRPVCLGGTPYASKSYHTGADGMARITTRDTIAAVRVTREGFQQSSMAFFPTNGVFTNCVVKMKGLAK